MVLVSYGILVGAVTIMTNSKIAIHTKHTIAQRIILLAQPTIDVWSTKFLPMLTPIIANMVYCKELNSIFTAAGAFRHTMTICLKNILFQFTSVFKFLSKPPFMEDKITLSLCSFTLSEVIVFIVTFSMSLYTKLTAAALRTITIVCPMFPSALTHIGIISYPMVCCKV